MKPKSSPWGRSDSTGPVEATAAVSPPPRPPLVPSSHKTVTVVPSGKVAQKGREKGRQRGAVFSCLHPWGPLPEVHRSLHALPPDHGKFLNSARVTGSPREGFMQAKEEDGQKAGVKSKGDDTGRAAGCKRQTPQGREGLSRRPGLGFSIPSSSWSCSPVS